MDRIEEEADVLKRFEGAEGYVSYVIEFGNYRISEIHSGVRGFLNSIPADAEIHSEDSPALDEIANLDLPVLDEDEKIRIVVLNQDRL